jgi:hypothetical protein
MEVTRQQAIEFWRDCFRRAARVITPRSPGHSLDERHLV